MSAASSISAAHCSLNRRCSRRDRCLSRIHRHRADRRSETAAAERSRARARDGAQRLPAMASRMAGSARLRKHLRHGDPQGRRGRSRTLSEAARARSWRLGAGYEFAHRPDGLPGLLKTYGLRMSGSPKTMDLGLLYQALSKKQVDMVAGNSTDGMLSVLPAHCSGGRQALLPAVRMRAGRAGSGGDDNFRACARRCGNSRATSTAIPCGG